MMDMQRETSPAPWGGGLPGSNPMTVFDAHGRRVAEVYDEADRALVRSAPDLYAALRAILGCPEMNWQETDDVTRAAIASARAALEKAEGRTP